MIEKEIPKFLKQKTTACVVYYTDERYDELAKNVRNSFNKFHPDCDYIQINHHNQKEWNKNLKYYDFAPETFLMQYIYAYEIMMQRGYDKVIILGTDTIVCSRLDEFLDDNETPILATLNYPCQESTEWWITPCIGNEHYNVNADVACFNSAEALKKVIDLSIEHYTHFSIQGGMNELVEKSCYDINFKDYVKIVDAPYFQSKVVYNCRSKGVFGTDMIKKGKLAKHGPQLDGTPSPIQRWYVKDKELFTEDHKQIKVFHFVEGLGGRPIEAFNELIYDFKNNWFNQETLQFFREECGCQEFFK